MRIYSFDPRSARPIDELGSRFSLIPVTGMDDGVRVVVHHLPRGGRVGRHPAVLRTLLCITAGQGWVQSGDDPAYWITAGAAALLEEGEEHEVWTDAEPMTVFVLEGDFTVPARLVKGRPIVVAEHDPAWASWFEAVRANAEPALADVPHRWEHVGSTSVPGLAAKPIVDVDVVVPAPEHVRPAIERLATLGYRHRGDLGIAGREAFVAPPGLPEHHLYVVVEGNPAHLDHVLLRDHLRAHPQDAARYAEVKRQAAATAVDDIDVYLALKQDVIREILQQARRG